MKKVWVLEKWITPERAEQILKDLEGVVEFAIAQGSPEDVIADMRKCLDGAKGKFEERKNGYWCGWEGKINYRQFCDCARAAINRADAGTKFRVVVGTIADDAQQWTGYTMTEVNDGVLRYLMATK